MEEDWYGPEAATFGDRIAAAREASGMKQDAFAKRLGVKLKTLKNWENDVAEPRANKLTMMAGMLNVSVMWLLNGEGDGLGAPEEGGSLPADLSGLLEEMRALHVQAREQADRIALLEKRLRQLHNEGRI